MNKNKKAILFTGKIYPDALDTLIEQTKNIEHKFASVWENEPTEYISKLSNNNFKIIFNSVQQQQLFTPQFITIVNGLNFLKENGFDYVLRSRFDIISTDYSKYIDLLCDIYPEKITSIAGIETVDGTYFLDLIIFGKVNSMCNFYKLQPLNDGRYVEKFLIENYSSKVNLTKDDIREIFNFSLSECIANNIEFIFFRPPSWKSSIRTIPDMRVIKEYCTDTFIWT